MSFEFEGNIYRDDRMYVINLSRGTVSEGGKKETRYLLLTYRNTASLPAVRTDHFSSEEKALDYLKQVEPEVPLVSNYGQPLDIPEDVDRWEYWNAWLKEQGLPSATTGYQTVPDWVSGSAPTSDYVQVEVITDLDEFEE